MRHRIVSHSAVSFFVAAAFALPAHADATARSGKEVVDSVCVACHGAGLNGAPRIGDREAWIARLKRGLHDLTLAAIRGHGGMPPRGGQASLLDAEMHNAIVYMFDPQVDLRAATAPAAAKPGRTNEAVVDGMRIHLGLMAADRLRGYPPGSPEARMHGGVPKGSRYYHVNVSVFEASDRTPIANARVEVEIDQPGTATQKSALEPMSINDAASYGGYVRLAARGPSWFTVRVSRSGSTQVSEAKFKPQSD